MRRGAMAAALPLALGACTIGLGQVREPGRMQPIPTAFPSNSMTFAARTDSGVVVFDLGWTGAGKALRRGLRSLGARPEDVTDVFLTHSHRDHIGAWRVVRHARFHLGLPEEGAFTGRETHADLPSRATERLMGNPAPWAGEVAVHPFTRDTAFVFGADTLRAYLVPGHTSGSAAYLFRGVLFVGDAVVYSYLTGFRPGYDIYSREPGTNLASLRSLFERVRPRDVRWVCTSHAKCARPDERFLRKVLRPTQ
ncbi:MAG TPA: MBL fold metallo-hydrolase [Longimicrobium sp.]|nr:MBL fold metallo-hydrolase [Longimicrobium sp.]